MAFVHRVLSDNEKLLAIARVHWIHAVKGSFWLWVPLWVWLVVREVLALHVYPYIPAAAADSVHAGLYYIFWAFILVGIMMFLLSLLHMMVTEMALTTKRVIYKTGWLFVQLKEVDLEEIKAADVDNGWFGRVLNYGYLILDARFVGTMNLASISYPYAFLRMLNKYRGELKDSMNVILEGREDVSEDDVKKSAVSPSPRNYTPQFMPANDAACPRPPSVFVPRKALHDKILQSFSLANLWR
ncbi:MAG: PH domain-containing protein [Alphaproteobacteria bacterium]|nr:PH domain-containing protein [Alphaproteobacteria bacterium]MCD8520615.1 PH domain-containing protein [Alphaproteobacteria bacterium]MCD8526223.1 PH domain-containing protein [Alphaproteobacteria bacterium]MCD8570759.1 PH domain-containing protein [Alphaproteobacteria bacterium]